jgi:hypothetical protein
VVVDVMLYETYQTLCEDRGVFPKGIEEFRNDSMLTHVISILRMVPAQDVPDIRNEGAKRRR